LKFGICEFSNRVGWKRVGSPDSRFRGNDNEGGNDKKKKEMTKTKSL